MIYWDNAATTWPKSLNVRSSIGQALPQFGANPGRAGHKMALDTAEMVYNCRQDIADFFGLSDPSGVVFTANCTMSINMVVQSIIGEGGRVLTSDLEHNAVVRPLTALSGDDKGYDIASWSPNADQTVENFRRAIRPDTKLILCTHASNVFGSVFPIRQLAQLAHRHGLLFCVDAAQTAGVLPINMEADDLDFLCVAPHKGLYAPAGTGLLLCRNTDVIGPLIRGGTGSYSLSQDQPVELPDRLESGTLNMIGIWGVGEGLRFVKNKGRNVIYEHEIRCLQHLYKRLSEHPFFRLYTPYPRVGNTSPVLSVNIGSLPSEEVAARLNERGVAVRAGLHCAPWAHRRYGTIEQGTVRLSPGAFSALCEAEQIAKVFLQIAEKSLHRENYML